MVRKFVRISGVELNQKIAEKFGDDYLDSSDITEALGKDLKVSFDFENFDYAPPGYNLEGLLGTQTLEENGLTFLGCRAGGDWEHPVFFMIYWDGKKLRGYVPTEGNPWNTTTKVAYGNDEYADLKNAKKRWPERFGEVEEVSSDDFNFDAAAIRRDILGHFELVETGEKKTKAIAKVIKIEPQSFIHIDLIVISTEDGQIIQSDRTQNFKIKRVNHGEELTGIVSAERLVVGDIILQKNVKGRGPN